MFTLRSPNQTIVVFFQNADLKKQLHELQAKITALSEKQVRPAPLVSRPALLVCRPAQDQPTWSVDQHRFSTLVFRQAQDQQQNLTIHWVLSSSTPNGWGAISLNNGFDFIVPTFVFLRGWCRSLQHGGHAVTQTLVSVVFCRRRWWSS